MDVSRIEWRKASRSTGNGGACVEVGVWRKASYSNSNGGNCVEVSAMRGAAGQAETGTLCLVRDSKDPNGPALAVTPAAWRQFTGRIKAGALDLG